MHNIFGVENFIHTFLRQLINIIHLRHPAVINKDVLMAKYNQLLMDRHSDIVFLIIQITKLDNNKYLPMLAVILMTKLTLEM